MHAISKFGRHREFMGRKNIEAAQPNEMKNNEMAQSSAQPPERVIINTKQNPHVQQEEAVNHDYGSLE